MCEPIDGEADDTDNAIKTRPIVFDWVAEHLARIEYLDTILPNQDIAQQQLAEIAPDLLKEHPEWAEIIRRLLSSEVS